MKKFSRCVLILILIIILSGVGGYTYEDSTIIPMYTSTTQLYVVPGTANEASVRASNGGLKDDFMIVFKSSVVIADAQKTLGTSEDIASYLTVSSPANSNIVEITCTNPDQTTAKNYVDAVAKTAVKTTTIIPVQSIQILSEGTSTNVSVKPGLYKKTLVIAGTAGGVCLLIEILLLLLLSAFKKPKDHSDDEFEYERYYGKYAALSARPAGLIAPAEPSSRKSKPQEKAAQRYSNLQSDNLEAEDDGDLHDILAEFDEDYAEDEDVQDEDSQKSALDAAFEYVAASAERSDQRTEALFGHGEPEAEPELKAEPELNAESERKSEAEDSASEPVADEQKEPVIENIFAVEQDDKTDSEEVEEPQQLGESEQLEESEKLEESAVHKTSQLTSSAQILGTIKK